MERKLMKQTGTDYKTFLEELLKDFGGNILLLREKGRFDNHGEFVHAMIPFLKTSMYNKATKFGTVMEMVLVTNDEGSVSEELTIIHALSGDWQNDEAYMELKRIIHECALDPISLGYFDTLTLDQFKEKIQVLAETV